MSENLERHCAQKQPTTCPNCGASSVVSILYGLPMDKNLDTQIERGSIVLGGCVVTGDDPQWKCTKCGIEIYRDAIHGNFE